MYHAGVARTPRHLRAQDSEGAETNLRAEVVRMGMERTLAIVKPDAMAAGHVGKVVAAYEAEGLHIVALAVVRLAEERARAFYAEHEGKPFHERLVSFMASAPCVPIALEGPDAIERVRAINGHTDPAQAAPGTLRARLGCEGERNAVHGSDSPASAEREVRFFFPEL